MSTQPYLTGFEHEARNTDKLSMWFTEPKTAARIARFAMEPFPGRGQTLRVLEPSCGRGALLTALGGYGLESVTGVDIDSGNVEWCRAKSWGWHPQFFCADFLAWSPSELFDIGIANPPFEDGQTEAHILHALEFCARVVCHCPLTTLAGKERRERLWSKIELLRLAICSSRPKYGEKAGATDMCTADVVLKRPGSKYQGTHVEWWP